LNDANVQDELDKIAAHMLLGMVRIRLPVWYRNFCDAQHLVDAFVQAAWPIDQLRADPKWITILRRHEVSIQVRTPNVLQKINVDLAGEWWTK
jgi:hypothetical protein